MAHVDYLKPIEALHGKIQKKDKIGFAKRQIEGTKYTFYREPKLYNPTETQKSVTTKFAAVCRATAARMANPSTRATDMAAFKAQSKYLTLQSYIWHQEWADYQPEEDPEVEG